MSIYKYSIRRWRVRERKVLYSDVEIKQPFSKQCVAKFYASSQHSRTTDSVVKLLAPKLGPVSGGRPFFRKLPPCQILSPTFGSMKLPMGSGTLIPSDKSQAASGNTAATC